MNEEKSENERVDQEAQPRPGGCGWPSDACGQPGCDTCDAFEPLYRTTISPVERASLLELATGWEREAGRLGYHGTPLAVAAQDLRRLLDASRVGERAKIERDALTSEIQRLRARDARIPSLDELDALLAKYRVQSHGEPIDLLGAIETAEARANAARVAPSGRRFLLLDCAAWALAAVCEIDGAQASAQVVVAREVSDEGGGP